MRLSVTESMDNLIKEARRRLPFNRPTTGFCEGRCDTCPEKLLEFLDMELRSWERRLEKGDMPHLRDLQRLGRECTEVYAQLEHQGLVPSLCMATT